MSPDVTLDIDGGPGGEGPVDRSIEEETLSRHGGAVFDGKACGAV
jgi:hypothetical protein